MFWGDEPRIGAELRGEREGSCEEREGRRAALKLLLPTSRVARLPC